MDRHLTLFQMRMKAYGATFVVSPACTHGMRKREHEKKGRKENTLNPFWCDVLAYGIHINASSLCFGVHHDLNNIGLFPPIVRRELNSPSVTVPTKKH